MNKTLTCLIILLAILALAIYFIGQKNVVQTLDPTETAFAIADTASITKIEILDKDKRKITLERRIEDGFWQLNTYYLARPDAINSLLKTMKRLKVRYPVSKSAYTNVIKTFDKPLRTVHIYTSRGQTPSKTYHIGALANNKMGNYMRLAGYEHPYVVHLPSMEGHITTRYFTELEQWRDRAIFRYNPDNIKQISIDYFFNPEHSFSLTKMENNSFELLSTKEKGADGTPKIVDQQRATDYLNRYKLVYAEAYQNDYPKTDSLRKTRPFANIKLVTNEGKKQEILVHFMPINRRSKQQFTPDGKAVLYDKDRYFAFIHKKRDLVIIQHYVFSELFKRYQDFLTID